MGEEGLDGFLVSNLKNVHYLSGYTGSSARMYVGRRTHFFTDFRYQEQSKKEVTPKAVIHIIKKAYATELADLTEIRNARNGLRIGFESSSMSVASLGQYKKVLRKVTRMKWIPTGSMVEKLRQIKEPQEVEHIARAAKITDKVLKEVVALVKPGVSERDLSAEISYRFMKYTGLAPAFSTIVASGPNSAMPHAKPTARKIRKGDLLTFDLGAQWKGYSADLTRTFVVGKPTKKHRAIYRIVLDAQQRALENMRAGMSLAETDALARDVISQAGYGEFFGHSLGHGVGLDTHDGLRLAQSSTGKLPLGAVVTVEPGIYLPGWGGVRIEDLVYVEKTGLRILSSSPRKKLIEL